MTTTSDPLADELAAIRAELAAIRAEQLTHRSATVAAVDAAGATFTAAFKDGTRLAGIPAPKHFLPAVGDSVLLQLAGAVPTYQPARIAAAAVTAAEIAAGAVTADKLTATAIDGKTITGSTLRTGATGRRVEVLAGAEVDGGGIVHLYPSSASPGVLEAGSDGGGGLVALSSPPNVSGLQSSLILRGVDTGDEGIRVDSTAAIDLYPATGHAVRINGRLVATRAPAVALAYYPGFKTLAGWQGMRTWRDARTGHATGVVQTTAAIGAGVEAPIVGLPPELRPVGAPVMADVLVNGQTAARLDIELGGDIQLVCSARSVAAGEYISITAKWPLD